MEGKEKRREKLGRKDVKRKREGKEREIEQSEAGKKKVG